MLLTAVAGSAWRAAAAVVRERLSVPLGTVTIGGAQLYDPSEQWLSVCGIDADGAVLVRPDGHIAWRSVGAAADAAATLEQVVARVLGFGLEARRAVVASRAGAAGRRCA
jgi:2,4-dichlorophenol 6-monooxygenase